MRTIAILQARMSSSRFPGKVLADLNGVPMVVFMATRVAQCPALDQVILATSNEPSDTPLAEAAEAHGLLVFRGSLEDVLGRFVQVQESTNADVIVRLTGDCPLADPDVIGDLIALRARESADYASNVAPRSYPHGLDCEVFTASALAKAAKHARNAYDREHVTPWMRAEEAGLKIANLQQAHDQSSLRLTVDHPADLEVIREVVLGTHELAGLSEVTDWLYAHPEVAELNAKHRQV